MQVNVTVIALVALVAILLCKRGAPFFDFKKTFDEENVKAQWTTLDAEFKARRDAMYEAIEKLKIIDADEDKKHDIGGGVKISIGDLKAAVQQKEEEFNRAGEEYLAQMAVVDKLVDEFF